MQIRIWAHLFLLTFLWRFPLAVHGIERHGYGDLEERMQEVLDSGIARYGIHGASATVILPDGTIWNGVSGVSHGDTAITEDMVYGIGSITKNVVAALTLKLVEADTRSYPSFSAIPRLMRLSGRIPHAY